MLEKIQVEKVKRFISDKVLAKTIQDILTESFLRPRGSRDIHIMAAERISVELLKEGFRELEFIAKNEDKEEKKLSQVGL